LRIEKLLASSILFILMKLPLLASCVLATVLAASPVFGQSEAKGDKPETAPILQTSTPASLIKEFFQLLTEGRVDTAYDQLLKGTKIAEMPKDVEMLRAQTREAIRVFGDINGYDVIEDKKVGSGNNLMRLTCISLGKKFPIRWRFYFYNSATSGSSTWKLVDIRIDDRLLDMFGEPTPITSGSAK